jgi:hypothetical protein
MKRDIFTNMLWLLAIICIINIMIMNTGCATTGKVIDWTLMVTTPYMGNFCEEIGRNFDKWEHKDGDTKTKNDSVDSSHDNEEDTGGEDI